MVELTKDAFPYLATYGQLMKPITRLPIGRDHEFLSLESSLRRPEMNNVALLGPAGVGKTSFMEGYATIHKEEGLMVFDIDLPTMSGEGDNKFAERIKGLADDVLRFDDKRREADETGDTIIFLDEMHLITMNGNTGSGGGSAAGNALKPLMQRGLIKIVGATTDEEYDRYIKPDQALTRRFQTMHMPEPSDEITVAILKNMAATYLGKENVPFIVSPEVYAEIVDFTNRYLPSFSQPAKSIDIMDAAIGFYRSVRIAVDRGEKHQSVVKSYINHALLARIMKDKAGVDVDWQTDIETVMTFIKSRVMGQDAATRMIENRLYIANARLQEEGRPMANFLFAGSTGVGKSLPNSEWIPVHDPSGETHFKRNGELKVGDYVFNRKGAPVQVLGVFPQGMLDVYEITFSDGRRFRCSKDHLWTWTSHKSTPVDKWKTNSLQELMDRGFFARSSNDRDHITTWIPMNNPVQFPEKQYDVDPYVIGALIGDGSLRESPLTVSNPEESVIRAIADKIGAVTYVKNPSTYSWVFGNGETYGTKYLKRIQTKDVLGHIPEMYEKYSGERRIPDSYKYGSIEQRWSLIQGLFDTDGAIMNDGFRYSVSFSTTCEGLASDVQEVVHSLGYSATVNTHVRDDKPIEYDVHILLGNDHKYKFFAYSKKAQIAEDAKLVVKKRSKKYSHLGILKVEKLPQQEQMTCIMIDDEEHLYQAGKNYIVTHNTELAKAMAEAMFGNEQAMIRYDMQEYSMASDARVFQDRISADISKQPYAVVLLDEMEKAHHSIMHMLLAILDDGRLTDQYGRQVTFTNAIMVVTTNGAASVFKDIRSQGLSVEEMDGMLRNQLGRTFSPEFLGRFDEIIPFAPLEEDTFGNIARVQLSKLTKTVQSKYGITLNFEGSVADYLVRERFAALTDTGAGGGRAMKRRIAREITPLIARVIDSMAAKGKSVGIIRVTVSGEMAIYNKRTARTDSHLTALFITRDGYKGELSEKMSRPALTKLTDEQRRA